MAITSRYPLTKTSGEVFQVGMDFSRVVNSGQTVVAASVSYTPYDTTLGIANISTTGSGVAFIVSTGTPNVNYRIQVTVNTSDSEILVGEGILKVRSI